MAVVEQYGAVYFDVREVEGLVVPSEGDWSIGVKAYWGADSSSGDLSSLGNPEWWTSTTQPTPEWTSGAVAVPVIPSSDDALTLEPVDFQLEAIRSKLVPLEDSALSLLVNTQLFVEVCGMPFSSDGTSSPQEILLGRASILLQSIITGPPGLDVFFPLSEGQGSLRVRAYLDDELAAFSASSSLLQVTSASFGPLPLSWAMPVPPNTPPEAVEQALLEQASGALASKQQYTIIFPDDTSENPVLPAITLPAGKISYEGEGVWSLSWPDASPAIWLSAAAQQALQAAVSEGVLLNARVTWNGLLPPPPETAPAKGAKKGAKAPPPEDKQVFMEVKTSIGLQPFAESGTTTASLEGIVDLAAADQQEGGAEAGQGVVTLQVSMAKPLVEVVPDVVPQLAPLDILPLRELVPKKPPRDVEAEFQKEIVDTIRVLSEEYVKNFVVKTRLKDLSLEDKRKRYFYLLNSTGIYHDLKEKLKPRIQRLVRKRFGQAPKNDRERDDLVSGLYSSLMEHVNSVINKRVKETKDANEDPIYEAPLPEVQRFSLQRVAELGMLADDAEANDQWEVATKHHEDRITIAQSLLETDESIAPTLLEAWQSFGNFCLRVPLDVEGGYRLRAREALKEALSISQDDNAALHVYAALLLEEGQYEDAKSIINIVVNRNQASVLTYVLLSLHADIGNDFGNTRTYLHKAVAAYDPSNLEDLGVPRRIAVVALLEVADVLIKNNLVALTQRTLNVADKCEAAALDKARERHLHTVTPVSLRVRNKRLRAQTLLSLNQLTEAESQATQATEICSTDGFSWVTLGEVKLKLGRLTEAKAAYAKALDALTRGGAQVAPRVFMRLGNLYMMHADVEKSREVMLRCCAEHISPSGWLKVGVACIKLNDLEDAEDALQEANVLDNRNGDVWGYLALLMLLGGEERLHEAASALQQAYKYSTTNTSLLRELASAYISIDHLSTAEDLLRRSLAVDPAAHTRRLLADVLASQNALSQAAAEYKMVIEAAEGEVDDWQRDDAFQQYQTILRVLGREGEISAY